jgi:2-keto-4-pentenoate hydratase/2-oxohepta-3-ene-1,7-dioic acid hydratase in catechol pathway
MVHGIVVCVASALPHKELVVMYHRNRIMRLLTVLLAVATANGLVWAQQQPQQQQPQQPQQEEAIRFARFQRGDLVAYGIVQGNQIRQIRGDLFGQWQHTDNVYALDDVKLLVPTQPRMVLALAGNYKSHLEDQPAPEHPELFFKSPSCLIAHRENVVIPKNATEVHFEAELVLVIGKRARNIAPSDAMRYVFGVTCGNDISERVWQANDVQWARAKASDTFGPCGPYVVCGVDYENLLLQMRVNGQIKQQQRTADLVHGVAQIISWASQHMTLEPGDLIFTGTPGNTTAIRPGDRLEVELQHVGILANGVVAER